MKLFGTKAEQSPDADAHASNDCNIHYLPHHAVVRSDHNTTKLRVIYNSSAETPDRQYSMKDCQEAGPYFTPHWIDILSRVRQRRFDRRYRESLFMRYAAFPVAKGNDGWKRQLHTAFVKVNRGRKRLLQRHKNTSQGFMLNSKRLEMEVLYTAFL